MLVVFFAAVVVFEADEGVVFRHQLLEGTVSFFKMSSHIYLREYRSSCS